MSTAHDQTSSPAAGRRGLVVPAVMTLAALPILLGLGYWQLERRAWKEALIASITEGLAKAPVPLEEPADAWKTLGAEEYRPVTVSGRFHHGDERHLFAVDDGAAGWHIITPLETKGGKLLFVNRGFVPDALKDPSTRMAGEAEGDVTVTGLVRKPGVKGWFEPDGDAARNQWYWRDLAGLTATLAAADRARVLPFFVDARAEPANPGGWPRGGTTRVVLPNRHLEYALTWFGLAGALVAVFGAFVVTRLRAGSGA